MAPALANTQTNNVDRLAALERQILSPEPAGISDPSAPSRHLRQILSRPEFAEIVRGPSAWERFKRHLDAWLHDHLAEIFKAAAQHPATSQFVFWAACVGAVGLIAFVLLRMFSRDERTAWSASSSQNSNLTNSADWFRAARVAADAGQYNKAIQCLYWAAVADLQEIGALPKTTGLTPREFVRAARDNPIAFELRKLTSALERFWYARVPANSEDFADCTHYVQALRGESE
jgi:hypothetical protein